MRVGVTGALGHIGSRLIRDLAGVHPGIEIVMLDNLATERHASLVDLPDSARYEFVEDDILHADLPRVFAGVDAVVHLAAITHMRVGDGNDQMRRVNVDGTARVARACASLGAPLLFPSTTSVYGMAHGVAGEESGQLHPHSAYAAWKLESEQALCEMAARDGLRLAICRMGTVFGPSVGMRFHTAVNRFCWRAFSRQPLEIWRTAAQQYRPYLALEDAVRAMLFILVRDQFDGRVYNVATTNATVSDVVAVLAGVAPQVQTTLVDSPLMNAWSYCADTGRLAQLGFEFHGSLERGIGETMQALLAQRRAALESGFVG